MVRYTIPAAVLAMAIGAMGSAPALRKGSVVSDEGASAAGHQVVTDSWKDAVKNLKLKEGLEQNGNANGNANGNGNRNSNGRASAEGNVRPSAVYTMTNQPNNEVIIHARDDATGLLTFAGTASTQGAGGAINASPDPTVSSHGIIVAGGCLLVCNTGSGEVSSFRILDSNSISYSDKVSSGGDLPVSIAHNPVTDTIYILNLGGSGSIQAVNLTQGQCEFHYPLDPLIIDQGEEEVVLAPPSAPHQVGLTPEGNLLVTIGALGGAAVLGGAVTPSTSVFEYPLNADGSIVPNAAVTSDSTDGPAPFGSSHTAFDFDSFGRLLIADATRFGGAFSNTVSGVSVLEPNGDGTYTALQDPIRLQDVSACWLIYHPRNNCVVIGNTSGLGTLSMLRSTESGVEVVQDPAASDLHAPLDLNFSDDGRFLYVLGPEDINDDCGANPGCGSNMPQIFVFEVDEECGLTSVQNMADGFPSRAEREATGASVIGMYGLAVYN